MSALDDKATHVEHIAHAMTNSTSGDSTSSLSIDHQQYLINRYGTLDLEPVPDPSDEDPLNWPTHKKVINLILVAFHGLMATFISSAIIPAYSEIAKDLGISLETAAYLTSLQIAILGAAPFFWKPISNRYGRRPVFMLSLFCSTVCNVGCGLSPDYASMAACRALVAFFISPAMAIGSGVVTEMFFKQSRARAVGLWTLFYTLGVPLAPFLFGFAAQRINYRWVYYILAITNAIQLVLYTFLGPETLYIRNKSDVSHISQRKRKCLPIRRIDPTPFTVHELFHPLSYFFSGPVFIASAAYAMCFLFGSVLPSVEIPQLFEARFGFNTEQLGLQFIGLIIGAILGEQIGGQASDTWMKQKSRKIGQRVHPEYRLWLSYVGNAITICGVAVFLVQLDKTPKFHYNVTPIVGAAFASGGNQIVTTVLVTYAIDNSPGDASSVGVFVTFVRQTWAFIGPFWLPAMFSGLGLRGSAALTCCLIVAVSIIPVVGLHFVKTRGLKRSTSTGEA